MDTLFMLEDSAIGTYVSGSQWGYAIVLSLHAVGMATIVGISMMLIFRVLGFARQIPLGAMAPYWKVGLVGFTINLISGTMLFFGSASELFFNWAFRIKFVLVVLGMILTWRLVRVCIAPAGTVPGALEADDAHRKLAGIALAVWLGALTAGRLIGYLA